MDTNRIETTLKRRQQQQQKGRDVASTSKKFIGLNNEHDKNMQINSIKVIITTVENRAKIVSKVFPRPVLKQKQAT